MKERFPCNWLRRSVIPTLIPLLSGTSLLQAAPRDWTNTAGKVISAEFIKLEGETVHLKLSGEKIGKVAISQLSEADQRFVRQVVTPPPAKPDVPVASSPSIQPKRVAPKNWPNDAGPAVPAEFTKTWVYPAGTARKIGDDYWTPDGEQVWKDSTFRANTLSFINGHATARLSFKTSEAGHGLIDRSGKFVIGGDHPTAVPSGLMGIGDLGDNGLVAFAQEIDGQILWGYMDLTGKVVLEPKWYVAGRFSKGLAAVAAEKTTLTSTRSGGIAAAGKYNYINNKGETEIEGNWLLARPFSEEGFASVRLRPEGEGAKGPEQWAFVRTDGSLWVPGELMDRPADFKDGRLVTQTGIFDATGSQLLAAPEGYRLIDALDGSGVCILSSLYSGMPQRLVDRASGKCFGPILNFKYLYAFQEGLACFTLDGKDHGFIDRSGKIMIEPVLRGGRQFDQGYFVSNKSKSGKLEYWNTKGEVFIER
jgi:hypothetical protein